MLVESYLKTVAELTRADLRVVDDQHRKVQVQIPVLGTPKEEEMMFHPRIAPNQPAAPLQHPRLQIVSAFPETFRFLPVIVI